MANTDQQENQPASNERTDFGWSWLNRGWLLDIQRNFWEIAFTITIFALVGVTSLAAYINVSQRGWNADAAAWAQAAGSIIAIAGAAWLARSEVRQNKRWRREQGEEAAWGVRFVISQAQFDAQIVAAELTANDRKFDIFNIRSWRQRSANASLALQTMLARVDHIHPFVIVTTCNAKILVDGLSYDIEKLEQLILQGQVPDDQLVTDIVYAYVNLSELIDQYDARVRGVRKALDRGRDMLPINEWPE